MLLQGQQDNLILRKAQAFFQRPHLIKSNPSPVPGQFPFSLTQSLNYTCQIPSPLSILQSYYRGQLYPLLFTYPATLKELHRVCISRNHQPLQSYMYHEGILCIWNQRYLEVITSNSAYFGVKVTYENLRKTGPGPSKVHTNMQFPHSFKRIVGVRELRSTVPTLPSIEFEIKS